MTSLGLLWEFSGTSLGSSSLPFLVTSGASCAEPSGARLRAADEAFLSLAEEQAHQGSNGKGEVQSASLLSRSVRFAFVHIPLARFPFLLSQVSVFVVKPIENHTFWHPKGSQHRVQIGPLWGPLWGLSWALSGLSLVPSLGPLWGPLGAFSGAFSGALSGALSGLSPLLFWGTLL